MTNASWLVVTIAACALALAGIIITVGRQTVALRLALAVAAVALLAAAVRILP
ncbi:hypothetical protein [Siccirubricoccus sp. G192]|uniref:hypothetical protein n=1 Tax=Siccirubricoccus sp. G192 TaxID=2849651 RepID=UPI001C2C5F27|nr:hypothetical protein [Siccirubricoccus sp. G192]MBV1796549.1 hypothetical protein [Siccirubricoccus sp. G192]